MRIWKDLNGKLISAEFVKFSGENVVIKKEGGQSFIVPISVFSKEDQMYLRELRQKNLNIVVGQQMNFVYKGTTLVVFVQGNVVVEEITETGSSLQFASKGTQIRKGDKITDNIRIRTEKGAETGLLFSNGALLSIPEYSEVLIRQFTQSGFAVSEQKFSDLQTEVSSSSLLLELKKGELIAQVKKLKKSSNFEISTPLGVAGIRGTTFRLRVAKDLARLSVLEGVVDFISLDQNVTIVESGRELIKENKKDLALNDLDAEDGKMVSRAAGKLLDEITDLRVSFFKNEESTNSIVVPSALNLEMLWVDAGKFEMGSTVPKSSPFYSENPRHTVRIEEGFYLGKFEVTQGQYEAIMTGKSNRYGAKPSYWKDKPNHPVENVSWNDVQEFLRFLNESEKSNGRLPNEWVFTLPSEAEWEYSCRAGSRSSYSWGSDLNSSHANWDYGNDANQTVSVGLYKPNAWGFHDMHGNVAEWTSNWFSSYLSFREMLLRRKTNPLGPKTGTQKVFRGGAWSSQKDRLRSSKREAISPRNRMSSLGFRLALKKRSQVD